MEIIARAAVAAPASLHPDTGLGSVVVVVAEQGAKVPVLPASLVGMAQARPMPVAERVRLEVPSPAGLAVVSVIPALMGPP